MRDSCSTGSELRVACMPTVAIASFDGILAQNTNKNTVHIHAHLVFRSNKLLYGSIYLYLYIYMCK
jgi:predicted DNA-binding protein with PD1-like motif